LKKAEGLAENVGGKVLDTGKNLTDKAANLAENVGGKILNSDALKTAEGAAENVGGEILNKSGDLANAAKGAAAVIGGGILAAGTDLVGKAKQVLDNPEASIDSAVGKAEEMAKGMIDRVKNGGELSDKVGYDGLEKSTLEGTDDFFARADRFAKGDYKNEGANKPENDLFKNTEEKMKEEGLDDEV